jgi:hypothetical protein
MIARRNLPNVEERVEDFGHPKRSMVYTGILESVRRLICLNIEAWEVFSVIIPRLEIKSSRRGPRFESNVQMAQGWEKQKKEILMERTKRFDQNLPLSKTLNLKCGRRKIWKFRRD